jgi:prepilin-type N-terminal cleavage/methylation domain-containing protein
MNRETGMKRQGFSLLELSIVLTIIAIVVAGSLTVGSAKITQGEIKSTYDEMLVIKDALRAFAKTNQRLPCPAPLSAIPGGATYGIAQVATTTTCSNSGVSGAFDRNSINGTPHYIGAVPVYTLGLQDEFLGDAWNGRYLYVVDRDLIANNGTNPLNTTTPTAGSLRIVDGAGTPNTLTDIAAWALISHGMDGRGSYNTRSGVANNSSCDVANYPLSGENCDFTGTAGNIGGATNDATFIDTLFNNGDTPATYFDDIIVWSTSPLTVLP